MVSGLKPEKNEVGNKIRIGLLTRKRMEKKFREAQIKMLSFQEKSGLNILEITMEKRTVRILTTTIRNYVVFLICLLFIILEEFAESFILKMLLCKGISKFFSTMEILRLTYLAKEIFTAQGRLIEIDGPVRICGDLHGQYSDLIRLFDKGGFPPTSNYIFLGDYVDRGKNSLETILLCLAFKVRYPNNFFMLRGNHECSHVNSTYGFKDEIFSRRSANCEIIYDAFSEMMDMMPLTGLIGDKILCMHGGLSPYLKSINDLRTVEAPTIALKDSLEMDLLWADPMLNQTGFKPNIRGASVSFGEDVVNEKCKQLGIDLIVRAHQVVQDGYEFFAARKLITIFSAPHYCAQFDNSAAMCVVSQGLEISFEVLQPETLDVIEKSEFKKDQKSILSNNNGN